MRHHRRKVSFTPLLLFSTLLFILLSSCCFLQRATVGQMAKINLNPEKSISCYRKPDKSLPDISEHNVRGGKSIFFHETSCRSSFNGKITVSPRQACAVESAALLNPNYDVYLTFSSPGIFKFDGSESDRMLQSLLVYENVKIVHLNFEKYTKSTPLEELYADGTLDRSFYAQLHASDVLRYLTLYKYGGIYLDLDVMVIKTLENLRGNFAGAENEKDVAAGIIRFSHEGAGRELARACVEDLKHSFSTKDWGANGPGVITRLSRKLCKAELTKDMQDCQNYRVHPREVFYPVALKDWPLYFTRDNVSDVFDMCRDSQTLHTWNRFSCSWKIKVGEQTAYTEFAKLYCPKVFEECDEYF